MTMNEESQFDERWQNTIAVLQHWETSAREQPELVKLPDTSYRSIAWKRFLLFESLDQDQWVQKLTQSRQVYDELKAHFIPNSTAGDGPETHDPLADESESYWKTARENEKLREEIFQDVERCMPDLDFFREKANQESLTDVLFVYCKLNADLSYRQGMHELAAPILYVVAEDSIIGHQTNGSDYERRTMHSLLDAKFVQADTFTLFCCVMQNAKAFYENQDTAAVTAERHSPIIARSENIQSKLLADIDPQLAAHLSEIEILPQIYIIRWLRLLFGREFSLQQVLRLWDNMFAFDPSLNHVDDICVLMLLRNRWLLLEAGYAEALALLLHQPVFEDEFGPASLVLHAMNLRSKTDSSHGKETIRLLTGREAEPYTPQRSIRSAVSRRQTGPRTPRFQSQEISNALTPLRDYVRDQGGLDNMLREAAKGAYERGEKWGLTKAVRGAIQGLQAETVSPRSARNYERWSLDHGRNVSMDNSRETKWVEALQSRLNDLTETMADAISELKKQEEDLRHDGREQNAESLSLSIAKFEYIQVQLTDERSIVKDRSRASVETPVSSQHPSDDTKGGVVREVTSKPAIEAPVAEERPKTPTPPEQRQAITPRALESRVRPRRKLSVQNAIATPTSESPRISQSQTSDSPFTTPRMTLAHSPLSWMLDPAKKEDTSKPQFSLDTLRGQGQSSKESTKRTYKQMGFLFGDPLADSKDD